MVDLTCVVLLMSAFFAYIGFVRGFSKEIIATAGIILGLFTLHQFDNFIRFTVFSGLDDSGKFYVQAILFLLIVFFGYQTRAIIGMDFARAHVEGEGGRDEAQSSVLGAIVGFINGYLIFGSIWYFLDINGYPLAPAVVQPPAGFPGAGTVSSLPLYVLAQGPGSPGDLLALCVIVLFIMVLIVI